MRLVYATDLSVEALAGARVTFALAERIHRRADPVDIDIVHVVEPRRAGSRLFEDEPLESRRVERSVRRWLDEHIERPADFQVIAREGRAAEQITAQATGREVDFLVVGQTGKGRFARMLLGSTAHQVAQKAPCKLMLAHREFAGFDDSPQLVAGVDFDETSRRALEATAELARLLEARLHAVHVFDPPKAPAIPGGIGGYAPAGDEIADLEREARLRMKGFLQRHRPQLEGVDVESHVFLGSPTKRLVEHAVACSADLLAVGTVAHRAIDRTGLGSIADGVVRHMQCSTLLVPPVDVP